MLTTLRSWTLNAETNQYQIISLNNAGPLLQEIGQILGRIYPSQQVQECSWFKAGLSRICPNDPVVCEGFPDILLSLLSRSKSVFFKF